MSDPVSNTEIEDVLSSIRRLVADDAKEARNPQAKADRLVLTPSQRVADEPEPPEPDAAEQLAERSESAPAKTPDLAALVGQEVERALDETLASASAEDAFEFDKSLADLPRGVRRRLEAARAAQIDPAGQNPQASPETETAQAPVEEPASKPLPEAESGEATPADVATDAVADTALEQKIAALEQLVADKGDEWEQEGETLASPMFQHNPTRSLEWQDAAEENGQAETVADQDPTEDEGEPPVALEAVSAEPASDTAETVEEADPSDADDQDMSTVTPFILHSAPDPEVDQERQPQNTEVADLLADNTVALDEEALRDLVGEMVRRELQGALGERITRNVRKLVRREIHRAMVAREFE